VKFVLSVDGDLSDVIALRDSQEKTLRDKKVLEKGAKGMRRGHSFEGEEGALSQSRRKKNPGKRT